MGDYPDFVRDFLYPLCGFHAGFNLVFFQSSLSLNVIAQNGRGTLGVSAVGTADQSVRDRPRTLSRGMTLRTDTTDIWSQGVLLIR
ncbi:hypothetical protein HC928_15650, partial [bacterium]|nr:hypothetical protein [bacterium]